MITIAIAKATIGIVVLGIVCAALVAMAQAQTMAIAGLI
jgi:hypothetical protein